MYNFMIQYEIGVNLKDNLTNKIYELTKINLEISKSTSPKGDKFVLTLEGVDIKNNNSIPVLIDMTALAFATQDDIEEYVLGEKVTPKNKVTSDGDMVNQDSGKDKQPQDIDGAYNPIEKFEAINRIYSIDEILDEVNRYKAIIKKEGDPQGVYQEKIDELNKVFQEISSKM